MVAKEMSTEELEILLALRTDGDGLVSGLFEEIEQDWVRVGRFWIALDARIPWQLAQCFKQHPPLLRGIRLRLNAASIERVGEHPSPLRKAHWWGARFRWKHLDSYGGPIVTVHGDATDPIQQVGMVAKAVFRWNRPRREPIAILQIEEFRDSPQTPAASFATRYLHSIVDLRRRRFIHLDGAIKTYTRDGYVRAYEGAEEKAGKYEKLFRTDDELSMRSKEWLDCVATFFANDELVREYFGGSYGGGV